MGTVTRLLLSAAIFLAPPAFAADSTISNLGAGSALVGSEPIPMDQPSGGTTKRTSPTAINTFVNTYPKTVAGATSGAIPCFTAITTEASSGLLAANALMIGGGAGVCPSTTATGTGVLTALGINVGSAGAFVTFNGAGGTPSSITLTNGTGLPISGIASLGTGVGTALANGVNTNGGIITGTTGSVATSAIPKGAGSGTAQAASSITDNGTVVRATEPFVTTTGYSTEIANAGVTGTTINTLTKLTGAPSTAVITATTDTDGVVGITIGGAGTTGSAQIATEGQASCVFDGATTAGDWVQISSTVAGNCHDTGSATRPTSNQVIGRVLSTNGAGGTYVVSLNSLAQAGGGGSSFPLLAPNGSNGAPSYSFSNFSTSGIYNAGGAGIEISVGGTDAFNFASNTFWMKYNAGAIYWGGTGDVSLTRVAANTIKVADNAGTGLGIIVYVGATVASLPACSATYKGGIAHVTDATATTYGSTVAGGGANDVQVRCNGTNWTIMGS